MSDLTTAEKCTMRDLANPELSVEFSTASKVMAEATAIINRLDQALMQAPAMEWIPTAQTLPEKEYGFLREQPHKLKFWIHCKVPGIAAHKTILVYRRFRQGEWEWGTRLEAGGINFPGYIITHWMAVVMPQAPQNT